ncbi:efflux RND transporter periplasmic adaptor subunit [Flammeovirga pectinis]|uniref:Efflux RND transporter periplasmic adaptor subunit n=1 Tax=Flammeovirga pectinis TaxID=2494373 RepID=A0A3Q9FT47_9BACT|nr:efflux RND transporter periplasmic adaptor subunit [Flammeovirga pectinis]AZQ65492.1 efflux RND transporter periplasmic adaptor subunit [Flammeovirga pectinis]
MKVLYFLPLLMALLFTSCYKKPDMYQAPEVPTVKVGHPTKEQVNIFDTYTGYTEALNKVSIVPRVTGELKNRYFVPGQFVKKGQLLFQLEKEPYLSQLHKAEASVERAKADVAVKEATYKSYKKLVKTSAVSELQYLESKAKVDESKAMLANAKSQLEVATTQYSYTKITAPINGVISDYYIDNGNIVTGNSGVEMAYIVDSHLINIYFTIPAAKYYAIVRGKENVENMSVTIMADDNKTMLSEGKVIYHDPKVDLNSGSITLKAQVKNKDEILVDGTYVRVKLAKHAKEDVLLIPQVAVERDQVGPYVYTVAKDTVEQHRIKLGTQVGENVIVTSGVVLEDNLIVSGIQRARVGIKVHAIAK